MALETTYSREYSCTLYWKPCLQCGESFYLKKAQKYCGKICMGKARRGSNNPAYYPAKFQGTRTEYKRYHKRVRDQRGSATGLPCTNCGSTKFCTWANQTGKYDDIMDYKIMCSKCHSDFDRVGGLV